MFARFNRLETLRVNGLQYNENNSIQCIKAAKVEKLKPSYLYDYIFVPVNRSCTFGIEG